MIKSISTRQRYRLRLYSSAAKAFKLAHPICCYCKSRKTDDVHHSRGRAGTLLLDEKYWLPLCRPCHSLVQLNPEWARRVGLLCEKGKWNSTKV